MQPAPRIVTHGDTKHPSQWSERKHLMPAATGPFWRRPPGAGLERLRHPVGAYELSPARVRADAPSFVNPRSAARREQTIPLRTAQLLSGRGQDGRGRVPQQGRAPGHVADLPEPARDSQAALLLSGCGCGWAASAVWELPCRVRRRPIIAARSAAAEPSRGGCDWPSCHGADRVDRSRPRSRPGAPSTAGRRRGPRDATGKFRVAIREIGRAHV